VPRRPVEARNFETRKHVLKYDDVMNRQRETIYGLRRQLMFEPEHREYLLGENGGRTRPAARLTPALPVRRSRCRELGFNT
jgi:hypothetical protein